MVVEQPGVRVHCSAGAGRVGLVVGAWGSSQAHFGAAAADSYVQFMPHIGNALHYTPGHWPAFAKRIGQPYVWCALCEIVSALSSPVTRDQPLLLPPEQPAEADH